MLDWSVTLGKGLKMPWQFHKITTTNSYNFNTFRSGVGFMDVFHHQEKHRIWVKKRLGLCCGKFLRKHKNPPFTYKTVFNTIVTSTPTPGQDGRSCVKLNLNPWRIHGTNGIFTYIWLKFGVNVGKYASPNGSYGWENCHFSWDSYNGLLFPSDSLSMICPGNTVQQLVRFRRIGLLCCFRSLEVWFQNSKYSHPKYPDPSKLAVLRTQPLLCRFKPFHWGVQWSLGQCMKKFLGMFEKKSLWKSLSILRNRKMRNSDSKVHVRPGSSWSLFEKNIHTGRRNRAFVPLAIK